MTAPIWRVTLYEIIGDGGRYIDVTRRATDTAGAVAKVREVYEPGRYRLAMVAKVGP